MTIGQDRYKRHYWVLPRCGGVFVEGMESDEGENQNSLLRFDSLFFLFLNIYKIEI